jgi:hypothetical protein
VATLLLAYDTLSPGLPFSPYCAVPVESAEELDGMAAGIEAGLAESAG